MRDSFMHGQSSSWIDRIDMLSYLFTRLHSICLNASDFIGSRLLNYATHSLPDRINYSIPFPHL